MAGHSKWVNTKHRKIIQDTKRSKIFTKIVREIVTSSRLGGSNLTFNSRLRAVVDKAFSKNMTRNTLNRAISRGIKEDEGTNMKHIMYEGYGPGGAAIIVECLSNNRNRTTAYLRHAFSKCGGNLSTDGSVSYLFKKKGIISFKKIDETTIIEAALKVDAEDIVIQENEVVNIYTAWNKVEKTYLFLEKIGLKADNMRISMIPSTKVDIDAKIASMFFHLINMLKGCDDTQQIYHNVRISNKETIFL